MLVLLSFWCRKLLDLAAFFCSNHPSPRFSQVKALYSNTTYGQHRRDRLSQDRMISLASRKRKSPPPQINILVPRDADDDDDDNERGGRETPTQTPTIPPTPPATTPAGPSSALATITVTAPAQTATVTMFVTGGASQATVTVTATPVSAIPAAETSTPAPNLGVNADMLQMDTVETSAAPAETTTDSVQTSGAMILGPGANFIAGVGVAGMPSFTSLPVVEERTLLTCSKSWTVSSSGDRNHHIAQKETEEGATGT